MSLKKTLIEKFAYDVTALPSWESNTMPSITETPIGESDFLGMLSVEEGVKGTRNISILNTDVKLQKIEGCSLSPDGSVIFTEKPISAVPMGLSIEFCNEDLNGKITEILNSLGLKRQNGQLPADLETILMAHLTKQAQKKFQNIVLKGNTASSDVELNFFDGIVKRVYTEAGVINVTSTETAITSTNAYPLAVSMFKGINEDLYDVGFTPVLVMNRVNALNVIESWNNANPYSQINVPTTAGSIEFDLPLIGLKIKSLPQLSGTTLIAGVNPSEIMMVLPLELTKLAVDDRADEDFVIKYDDYNDKLKAEMKFRGGVAIVLNQFFTKLTLA